MTDYSSQNLKLGKGRHAETIELEKFQKFLNDTKSLDFDIMLEIKDKEDSAKQALEVLSKDERFYINV